MLVLNNISHLTTYPFSDAILRYLAARYKVASNWYPDQLESRARVDEFSAWSHTNLSLSATGFFEQQVQN